MDGEDFAMPSPKRQRTDSPESIPSTTKPIPAAPTAIAAVPTTTPQNGDKESQEQEVVGTNDENEMLDALMQHVESEAAPNRPVTPKIENIPVEGATQANVPIPETHPVQLAAGDDHSRQPDTKLHNLVPEALQDGTLHDQSQEQEASTTKAIPEPTSVQYDAAEQNLQVNQGFNLPDSTIPVIDPTSKVATQPIPEVEAPVMQETEATTSGEDHLKSRLTEAEQALLQIDGIPPTEAIERADGEVEPEWEVDSSPYESSTDSDSTDSSDEDSNEDDDDADGDYAMLDPEEAARILMQGDAGSDDEGEKSKGKGERSALRTANEQMEDVYPIPDIIITDEMKTEELGVVEAVVENNVLIRGKVSGEYRVLESGSLLCLQNRAIAGVVAETLGRVEQPLYTVRFRNEQDIKERGLSEKGTIIYYVPQHSTFVFTQPLKAFKGSDASNFHDEEVGDDEMEFSDDEAEAEHKRQMKLKRQGRSGDVGRGRGSGRGGRGAQRGGFKPSPLSTDINGAAYGNGSIEMNYDDVEEGEEGYTPLARPTNLHEMMPSSSPTETSNMSYMPPPPFSDRSRGRSHHRGGRGHDRGGRGGRGNHRGTHNNNSNRGGNFQQGNQSHGQYANAYPNPFAQGQYAYSQPPAAPSLTPHNPTYPYSVVTSPISPLPKSQFNFGSSFQPAQQSYSPTFQQQQQWAQQMPAGFVPQFNNPAMLQFAQQFQQSQQQQQQQQQPPQNPSWQVNQAAAAEVQRQLEEMRRTQGGGQ